MFKIMLFVACLYSSALNAKIIPGDSEYFQYYEKLVDTNFIFPSKLIKKAPKIIDLFHRLDRNYIKSFDWNIDSTRNFIFTSENNQVPNAYATILPLHLNFYYWGGVELVESMASRSLIFDLVSHELSHMYQMDPKSGFAQFSYDVFGHTPFIIFPFIPIYVFPFPNGLHPLWILEGNAVLNESRFGAGGRLYSAEFKALFYTLMGEIDLTQNRITNSHLEFPYNSEKYVLGAYFSYFLAEKFGIDRVNKFFAHHGNFYFNPFRLNASFSEYFNQSYSQSINDFIKNYKESAIKQRKINESILVTSLVDTPLNRDENEIFFLVQNTGMSKNELWRINRKKLSINKKTDYFVSGKVFKFDDQDYVTRGFARLPDNKIIFALWSPLGKLIDNTDSKYFLDIRNKSNLYLDVQADFDLPFLKQDNNEWGKINSHAILSYENKPIYFIQKGNKRNLYHGKNLIYQYQGYYGKIVDVDNEGNIYFIANTKLGSGLFKTHLTRKDCFEMLESDRVIDAKLIDYNRVLIREVSGSGFNYKIASFNPDVSIPYWDELFFDKSHDMKLFDQWKFTRTPPSFKKEIHSNIKSYNNIKNIQFSNWGINTYLGENIVADINFKWSDPLLQNNLSFDLSDNFNTKIHDISLEYSSSRWRIMPFITLLSHYYEENPQRDGYSQTFVPDLKVGFRFPYYIRSQIVLTSKVFYQGILTKFSLKEAVAGIKLKFGDNYFLNFDYNQLGSFEFEYAKGDKNRHRFSSQLDIGYGLNSNVFVAIHGQYVQSTTGKLIIGAGIENQLSVVPTQELTYYDWRKNKKLEGYRFGALIRPVINSSLYFESFPMSLRRFAPMLFANNYSFKDVSWPSRPEIGAGVSWELLLGHNLPIKINTIYIYRKYKKENIALFSFGLDI